MKDRVLQIASVGAFLLLLAFNYLALAGILNDVDTRVVAARYPNQLSPANWAFSIWSVIYVGLLAFTVVQALPSNRDDRVLKKVRPLFIGSCIANALWLVAWHYDLITLSIVVMLALLAILALISVNMAQMEGAGNVILFRAPFNLYFGWITVATILNATIVLVAGGAEPNGSSGAFMGAALILVAAALGTFIRFRLNTFLYPIAISWGVTAIAVRQSGNTPVVVAAAIAVVVLLFIALWGAVKD